MKEKCVTSNAEMLRNTAEVVLKSKPEKKVGQYSEAETLKLIHELEVHQIELELQNEELVFAKEDAELAIEKYIELYDFAPVGYVTLSMKGKIININLAGASMLNRERSRLVESQFGFFVSEDKKAVFNLFFENILKSNSKENCEVILNTKNNQPMYVLLTGIATCSGTQCFVTMVDISEKKNNEIQLEKYASELSKLNADKDRFISILAHDLKNPFSSILGFLDLLSENVRIYNVDKIEEIITLINKATHNVYGLLENISLWVRSHSGKLFFKPEYLNFKDIYEEVLEIHKINAIAKNITIHYLIASDIYILADSNMVKTILRNLISNAIKFTGRGGQIDISAEQNHKYVTISVSDNGVGIEPEKLKKLFDFSHIYSTNGTAGEGGTGLGLLLCKELVERHGGEIWAESDFDGTRDTHGSIFKFTLPISIGVSSNPGEKLLTHEK